MKKQKKKTPTKWKRRHPHRHMTMEERLQYNTKSLYKTRTKLELYDSFTRDLNTFLIQKEGWSAFDPMFYDVEEFEKRNVEKLSSSIELEERLRILRKKLFGYLYRDTRDK